MTAPIVDKRGQSWSIDYAVSLVLFIIAVVIVIGIINNTFEDRAFQEVNDDARRLSQSLMASGYPEDWDSSDLLRVGILAEGSLSMRKMIALTEMDYGQLKPLLPVLHDFFIVLNDENGEVVAIKQSCGIGRTGFPVTTDNETRRSAVAYYTRSSGPSELQSWATVNDADEYQDEELIELLENAYRYGLIVMERPALADIVAAAPNSTRTAAQLRESFIDAAALGPIFVITGDMGATYLGAYTLNASGNQSTVIANEEPYFRLNESAELNMTGSDSLFFATETEQGALAPLGGATHITTLATVGANVTAARWQYKDALVYYFAGTEGDYSEGGSGRAWRSVLEAGLSSARVEASINCTIQPELLATEQLVKIDRLVASRGKIYTLSTYVWE